MSTLEPQPVKQKIPLNSQMLTIAAILLIVLALLFLASPLLGLNRLSPRTGNFQRQFNGQTNPGTGNGQPFTFPGGQNGGGNGFQNPGGTNGTGRTFTRTGLLGLGFLRGTGATIIYGIALLISLAAVIGMLSLKRWGQVLGIVMGIIYFLLALLGLLPTLLLRRFIGAGNPLSLILSALHLLLAIGVIVFALIPARKLAAPAAMATPPTAPAS